MTKPSCRVHCVAIRQKNLEKREIMTRLRDALAAGEITPVIDRTFALEEAAAAIGYLTTGQARGRIVLVT